MLQYVPLLSLFCVLIAVSAHFAPSFPLIDYGMSLRLWTAATSGHVVHPPDDMSLESDVGMIYWQGKTEELGDKPVPVPLRSPQIPHEMTRARTRASAVRGRLLIAWAMARPRRSHRILQRRRRIASSCLQVTCINSEVYRYAQSKMSHLLRLGYDLLQGRPTVRPTALEIFRNIIIILTILQIL
jgi:hypothetical protein